MKFEMERLYHDTCLGEAIQAGFALDDIPLLRTNRAQRYSLETLRSWLRECQVRGWRAGMYMTFRPPDLMEELEDCYAGRLRSKRPYTCETFLTATSAPDGPVISCYTLRVPFGNIPDTSLEEIWNSEAAQA